MTIIEWIQFGLTVGISAWAVIQIFVTQRFSKSFHVLQTQLDQSLGLLQRARDAAVGTHRTEAYMLEFWKRCSDPPSHDYMMKSAEFSSSWAELRGLAFAIGDEKLLAAVNNLGHSDPGTFPPPLDKHEIWEMESRGQFQRIHTRIAELLEEETQRSAR